MTHGTSDAYVCYMCIVLLGVCVVWVCTMHHDAALRLLCYQPLLAGR